MRAFLFAACVLLASCSTFMAVNPPSRIQFEAPVAPPQPQLAPWFAGVAPVYTPRSMGSTFCVGADEEYSYWMTAHHVIDDLLKHDSPAPVIEGRPAPIHAIAPEHDLAILRRELRPNEAVVIRKFSYPNVGDRVLAPSFSRFGGKEVRTFHVGWVISVDFPNYPGNGWVMTHNGGARGGNSGGPVMDTLGRVMGVSVFFADSGTGFPLNMSELCAVPGQTAEKFWNEVQAGLHNYRRPAPPLEPVTP